MESEGYSLVAVHRLLAAAASLVEHGLQGKGLGGCGTGLIRSQACGNLPGPGIKSMSLAVPGGFLTTRPPGKS